jgi:hypothetical protein
MAGDAPVAQPQLGPSRDHRLHRAPVALCRGAAGLERALHRRHLAAARRADADGPCLAPDRARRRHLDAAAATCASAGPSARTSRRSRCAGPRAPMSTAAGPARITRSSRPRPRPRRRAHLRLSRRQGADVQRRDAETAPTCARSGPGTATTTISTSACLPAGRARLRRSGRPAPGRRLRRGAAVGEQHPQPAAPDPNAPPRARAANSCSPTFPINAAPSSRRADPRPPPPLPAAAEPVAEHYGSWVWETGVPGLYGFSAIEVSDDGSAFTVMGDGGQVVRGRIHREDGRIAGLRQWLFTSLKSTAGGELEPRPARFRRARHRGGRHRLCLVRSRSTASGPTPISTAPRGPCRCIP